MTPYESAGRAYTEAAVMTASPERLVVMLYDGAIRFLRQAATAARAGRRESARKRLNAAQAILGELTVTLDHRQGEIAARLWNVYRFCSRHLIESTANSDPDGYDEVATLLEELRASWAQIADQAARAAS